MFIILVILYFLIYISLKCFNNIEKYKSIKGGDGYIISYDRYYEIYEDEMRKYFLEKTYEYNNIFMYLYTNVLGKYGQSGKRKEQIKLANLIKESNETFSEKLFNQYQDFTEHFDTDTTNLYFIHDSIFNDIKGYKTIISTNIDYKNNHFLQFFLVNAQNKNTILGENSYARQVILLIRYFLLTLCTLRYYPSDGKSVLYNLCRFLCYINICKVITDYNGENTVKILKTLIGNVMVNNSIFVNAPKQEINDIDTRIIEVTKKIKTLRNNNNIIKNIKIEDFLNSIKDEIYCICKNKLNKNQEKKIMVAKRYLNTIQKS